jgi:hypothetical protein
MWVQVGQTYPLKSWCVLRTKHTFWPAYEKIDLVGVFWTNHMFSSWKVALRRTLGLMGGARHNHGVQCTPIIFWEQAISLCNMYKI